MLVTIAVVAGAGVGIVSGLFSTYVTWLNWKKVKAVEKQLAAVNKTLKLNN